MRDHLLGLHRRAEELAGAGGPAAALAEAWGELGGACLAYAMRGAAVTALSEARRLAPSDPRWSYLLGVAREDEGRLDEAAGLLARTLELVPDDGAALHRLARLELERGGLEAARQLYERALAREPDSAAAHHGLGLIAQLRGDAGGAVARFSRALELQPAADSVHYPLALALRDLGRHEESRAHLARRGDRKVVFADPLVERLRAQAVGTAVALERGGQALAAGDGREALRWYREAERVAPRDPAVLAALASTLAAAGEAEDAASLYRRMVELAPDDPVARYNLGSLLARRAASLAEGIAHLRHTLALAPGYVAAHVNLGAALERAGRPREAIAHYDRALESDPDAADARLARARLRLRLGATAGAVADLEDVASRDAEPARRALALAYLGTLRLREGALEDGVGSLRQALALDGGLVPARLELAGGLARQGRHDEAVDEIDEALARAPRDERAHLARAVTLLTARRDGEARDGLERGLALLPESVALRHLLARLLAASAEQEVRDPPRALELAGEVLGSEASVEHGETMAMALAAIGRFEEAATRQRSLLARAESAAAPAAVLAAMRARLGEYERGRPVRAPWRADG